MTSRRDRDIRNLLRGLLLKAAPTDPVPIPGPTRQRSHFAPVGRLLVLGFFSHACVELAAQLPSSWMALEEEAVHGARGYEWLEYSTIHIGHRLTGTDQGGRATELADSLFTRMGLQVGRVPFEAEVWMRGALELTYGEGTVQHALRAESLANTPLTVSLRAPLIDAGNGLRDDMEGLAHAIPGKAVLMNLGLVNAPEGTINLHRSEKVALAIEHGAAAVVFVNQAEHGVLLTGTASLDGRVIGIPAVCIGSEDGELLRSQISPDAPIEVAISMSNAVRAVRAESVVARLPGDAHPEEVIVIGGHLDSWDLASGATDNGLGAFSILDLARCLTAIGYKPSRTIVFALFMGEEQGLLGSTAWLNEMKARDELRQVRCMINLDMTGGPYGFNVVGGAGWTDVLDTIGAEIQKVDTSFRGVVDDRAYLHSDHQPFLLEGVPVILPMCDLGGHVYGCYHSSCDDIHLVDPRRMVDNVRFVGMLATALADRAILPHGLEDQALRDKLRDDGLEEKLRIQGEWRW